MISDIGYYTVIRYWDVGYYIFIRVGDGGYHDLFRRANVISDEAQPSRISFTETELIVISDY